MEAGHRDVLEMEEPSNTGVDGREPDQRPAGYFEPYIAPLQGPTSSTKSHAVAAAFNASEDAGKSRRRTPTSCSHQENTQSPGDGACRAAAFRLGRGSMRMC